MWNRADKIRIKDQLSFASYLTMALANLSDGASKADLPMISKELAAFADEIEKRIKNFIDSVPAS